MYTRIIINDEVHLTDLDDVQLVCAVLLRPEPGLPPQSPGNVTPLCRELLAREAEVGQVQVVTPHGDLLLGDTVPVLVTHRTEDVPVHPASGQARHGDVQVVAVVRGDVSPAPPLGEGVLVLGGTGGDHVDVCGGGQAGDPHLLAPHLRPTGPGLQCQLREERGERSPYSGSHVRGGIVQTAVTSLFTSSSTLTQSALPSPLSLLSTPLRTGRHFKRNTEISLIEGL